LNITIVWTAIQARAELKTPVCGDGYLDPGEECDDGQGNGTTADCCSTACTYFFAGKPCAEDDEPCTVDECNGVGLCVHDEPTPKALGDGVRGCTPPASATRKCANTIAKQLAKLGSCIARCHIRAVTAAANGRAFPEGECEAGVGTFPVPCLAKFRKHSGLLTSRGSCPLCLGTEAQARLADELRSLVESSAHQIYCDGTSSWGDGDDGLVPREREAMTCENGVQVNIATLATAVLGCHRALADARFVGQAFDASGCEDNALSKFETANASISGCPSCVVSALPSLGSGVTASLDAASAANYCTSVTPAFLE